MPLKPNRRLFLKSAATTAGGICAAQFFPGTAPALAAEKKDKLNCVVIGCGGRGGTHINTAAGQNLVALVDADEAKLDKARNSVKEKVADADKIQVFTDYRAMYDKIGKQIDAVFIATPNHQHALPSMIGMQLGKGVYCEKPLCHTIAEARDMAKFAEKYKVATQMGNQGHCDEGYRRLCEYVWAGVVGDITETHSWSNRANGGIGERPPATPTPAGLHWDSWIGPAPYRDFHADLHPHEWHGWYDFGNGSLGNMGCHVLDGVYWALRLEHPTTIEVEQMFGGSPERLPTGTRIRWDFPARAEMPAVKVYWYDGRLGDGDTGDSNTASGKGTRGKGNVPPLLTQLAKEYPDVKFDSNGTLYIGTKGMLYTGTYGGGLRILPKKLADETKGPAKTVPRTSGAASDFLPCGARWHGRHSREL